MDYHEENEYRREGAPDTPEETRGERVSDPEYEAAYGRRSEGEPVGREGVFASAPPPSPWWRARRGGCLPLLALLGALALGTLLGAGLCHARLLPLVFGDPLHAVLCGGSGSHPARADSSARGGPHKKHAGPALGSVPGQPPASPTGKPAGSPPPPSSQRAHPSKSPSDASPWWCKL